MAVNSFDQVHAMAQLSDDSARTDLLNRLKRAEGQLRGVQRMIEAG
jgi:DNA-binding FrmR family transcriptional regulator